MVLVRLRHGRADDGAVAILVAMLSVVLFGFGAIVVDLGMARTVRQQAQDSADAAALAGADALYDTSSSPNRSRALRAIRNSARANFDVTSWAGCDAAVGGSGAVAWDGGSRSGTKCIQFGSVNGEAVTQVFVAMPARHLDPILGGVIGSRGVNVHGQAVAGTTTTSASLCGLCVYGVVTVDTGGRVEVNGGGSFSAGDGVLPNIDSTLVVKNNGKITFDDPPTPPAGATYDPEPIITGWPVPPLVPRPPPTSTGPLFPDTTCDDDSSPLRRGTYASLNVTGDCDLRRGVFTVTGLVHINPGARLSGGSSTLVMTGAATLENQGRLSVGGNRNGFSLYWASSARLDMAGTSITLDGDVHAPATAVDITATQVDLEGTMSTGDLHMSPTSRLSVTAGGAPISEHGELGLVQ